MGFCKRRFRLKNAFSRGVILLSGQVVGFGVGGILDIRMACSLQRVFIKTDILYICGMKISLGKLSFSEKSSMGGNMEKKKRMRNCTRDALSPFQF